MDLNFLTNLGLLFLISLLFGKLANFIKAPRLVGYLTAGVLFGPYILNLFSRELVNEMQLFTEMALSIIAFSIGASLKLKFIQQKKEVISGIAILQAVAVLVLVAASLFGTLYFLYSFDSIKNLIGVAILIGAICASSAPATILSLVREYKASGQLTNILLGVVAFSDAVTIILYSIAFSIASVLVTDAGFNLYSGLGEPLLHMTLAVALGLATGLVIKFSIKFFPGRELLLGLMLGAVFLIAGIAIKFDISHLLAIMVFAFYIENFAESNFAETAYRAVDEIEEPILGVFFLLAGAHLDLTSALSAGALVLVVLLSRTAGKFAGNWLAASWTKAHHNVRKYMGLALLPSAGVAIGLILDARSKLADQIPELAGIMVSIIIGKTLVNEFLSPFLVKYVLKKSGEISRER